MPAWGHEEAGEIRVLVAGSDASSRSLREDLVSLGFSVCAAERDASGAVAAAAAEKPDLSVLAADLPGSAVLATAQITEAVPRTRVVILAAALDEEDCLTYLLAGAAGYLEGDVGRERLGAALRDTVAGEAVVPAEAKKRLLEELRTDFL